jgi:hypothetical protein
MNESRLKRRLLVVQLAAMSAAAPALAQGSKAPPRQGPTDTDPNDAPNQGRGGAPRGQPKNVTDSDPTDAPNQGRGGERPRSGLNDADPQDPAAMAAGATPRARRAARLMRTRWTLPVRAAGQCPRPRERALPTAIPAIRQAGGRGGPAPAGRAVTTAIPAIRPGRGGRGGNPQGPRLEQDPHPTLRAAAHAATVMS